MSILENKMAVLQKKFTKRTVAKLQEFSTPFSLQELSVHY